MALACLISLKPTFFDASNAEVKKWRAVRHLLVLNLYAAAGLTWLSHKLIYVIWLVDIMSAGLNQTDSICITVIALLNNNAQFKTVLHAAFNSLANFKPQRFSPCTFYQIRFWRWIHSLTPTFSIEVGYREPLPYIARTR